MLTKTKTQKEFQEWQDLFYTLPPSPSPTTVITYAYDQNGQRNKGDSHHR